MVEYDGDHRARLTADRKVHGVSPDGAEIVRYDRAGKWYLEHPISGERRKVTVAEAAALAVQGHAFLGIVGGQLFDFRVREAGIE